MEFTGVQSPSFARCLVATRELVIGRVGLQELRTSMQINKNYRFFMQY